MPALFFLIFLLMAAFAMLLPSVMYVLTNLGVSPTLATPVLASYSFAQFLAGPAWGRLSDRLGRKPVLAMTITGACLSYVGMTMVGDTVAGIFICYAAAGIFAGGSAVVYASVTDITGPEKRAKGMGIIGAGIGLAFTVGPAIGAFLGGKSAAEAGLELPATASAVICLIGLLVVLFWLKETATERHTVTSEQQVGRIAAMKRLAGHPVLLQMAVMLMAFTMAMTMMESTLPLLAHLRHDWGPRDMGKVFAYIGLVLIFVQGGLVGRMAQRFGERALARFGLLSMAIGLGVLAFIPDEPAIFVGLTFAAVGSAFFNTSMLALASHRAKAHERGLIMGVFQSMQPLGRSVGPLVAGAFYQMDHVMPLVVGGSYMMLAFLWFAALRRRMDAEAEAAA